MSSRFAAAALGALTSVLAPVAAGVLEQIETAAQAGLVGVAWGMAAVVSVPVCFGLVKLVRG